MDSSNIAAITRRAWVGLLALLVLVVLGLRVGFFLISTTVLQPSTDESISALLAGQIRHGTLPLLFMAQPYLFPVESYVMAPLVGFFPPGALAARLPVALMHALALAIQLALLWRVTNRHSLRFAGAALLLIPSSYVLMIQSAYSMPGYATISLGGFITLALAAHGARAQRIATILFLLGFTGGLTFACHQLGLTFLLPAAWYAWTSTRKHNVWRRAAALCGGLLSGLMPYLIARWLMPGAHAAAEQVRAAGDIVVRCWKPGLTYTLQGTLGWRTPPFPDEPAPDLEWQTMGRVAAVFLLGMILLFLIDFIRARVRSINSPRMALTFPDVFWIIFLLNLLFFAASGRATSASYRYLLPAALIFPYLLVDLAQRWPGLRQATFALAILLLFINTAAIHRLTSLWRTPDFAGRVANIPDVKPALDFLREIGIHHAVASYGAAYRITYLSGGSVICTQPYNERFATWPYPYQAEVWAAPRIAYVLTDRISFLKPSVFERHLRTMGVTATIATAGAFRIYYDFDPSYPVDEVRRIRAEDLSIAASAGARPVAHLNDGNSLTIWTTPNTMRGGEWIEARWPTHEHLNRVVLIHGAYHHDVPTSYEIQLHDENGWRVEAARVPAELDKFEVDHGHPRYGRSTRTFRLNGTRANGVRIAVESPRTNRNWTVAEIEVYVQDAPAVLPEPTGETAP